MLLISVADFDSKRRITGREAARFFPWKQSQESQLVSNSVLAGLVMAKAGRTPVIRVIRHVGLLKAATNVIGYSLGQELIHAIRRSFSTGVGNRAGAEIS